MKARLLSVPAILAAVVVIILVSAGGAASAATRRMPDTPAPPATAPGSESYFDLARKDCVGTARNTTSKVWFTVADGVLSDTYWPTVDATNVHTLQYLVTDGGTSFTDLQTRDMTYSVMPDPTGMSCTVVASPKRSDARLPDHHHLHRRPGARRHPDAHPFQAPAAISCTCGSTRWPAAPAAAARRTPAATRPLSTGNGTVPVAFNTNTTTNAVNRDYAVPTFRRSSPRAASRARASATRARASDGLNMLDSTTR